MAVLFIKTQKGEREIGRTEVIMNTLNPVWITKFNINYQFEAVQQLVFRIFDVDGKYHDKPVTALNLKQHDFLGEASCALSEIVTKQSRSITLDLRDSKELNILRRYPPPGLVSSFMAADLVPAHLQFGPQGRRLGNIIIQAEETIASKTVVELEFRCSKLRNRDIFSKSDPFLKISKISKTGNLIPICKTEVVDNNLNPSWKTVMLTAQQYGDRTTQLIVECFDFDTDGKHAPLGRYEGTVADFERLYNERAGEHLHAPSSFNHKIQKTLRGKLFVDYFSERRQYSFVDYISSGFELNFMVAVDFTASNGSPHLPTSLHYIDPSGRPNAYQQAIQQVGDVIQFYDSDRKFPAWGFGGKLPDGTVSHCFNLNGSPGDSEVDGVQGIMDAYKQALLNIALNQPTFFAPVINHAAQIAKYSISDSPTKYYVLLIITDGVVCDFQETTDAIVYASDLPLSILIVGVGTADFKAMEVLDADNGRRLKNSRGQKASRDIVQFVPMRDVSREQVSIIQLLLEELPGQFLSYMRSKGIKPQDAGAGPTPVGMGNFADRSN